MQKNINALIWYEMRWKVLFGLLLLFWPLDWIFWITLLSCLMTTIRPPKYLPYFYCICLLPKFLFLNLLFLNNLVLVFFLIIMDNHHHLHSFPCLDCQPHTYIRMVLLNIIKFMQHLFNNLCKSIMSSF